MKQKSARVFEEGGRKERERERELTSGGMAKVHIVTPANPPATMTAERERAAGSCPAGVKVFFTYSYATNYTPLPLNQYSIE